MNKFSAPIFALFLALCFTLSSITSPVQESFAASQAPGQPRLDKNAPSKKDRKDDNAAPQKPSTNKPVNTIPDQKDTIRLETKLVSTIITVSDPYGRFVTGLTEENFEIFDDNVKQEIAIFSDEDAPITLGIVYDVSGSMGDLTSLSFQALKRFFHTSHEDDEYFIIAFNNKPKLVQDFTTSPNEILNRTVFIQAKGATALYDAVYLATEKVKQGRHAKKALLIISDGQENNSRYSGKELGTLLKESDVQIYALGMGENSVATRVLELAGGRVYSPIGGNEIGDIYIRMALLLRHQYVIGFYPTDTTSATKWHEVKVKIKAPKGLGRLSLSYKKGYQSFSQ
jgi:Ca-activated chloride channel family protein